MHKVVFVIPCVVMLLMAGAALVEEPDSPSKGDPRRLCEQALDRLMLGDVEGIDLFDEPPWATDQEEAPSIKWAMFRTQLQLVKDRIPKWGEPFGYELLEEKQYGTTFLRYKYVVKYERKFVIWTFLLVRLKGPWSLHRVDFNTDLEALFE